MSTTTPPNPFEFLLLVAKPSMSCIDSLMSRTVSLGRSSALDRVWQSVSVGFNLI